MEGHAERDAMTGIDAWSVPWREILRAIVHRPKLIAALGVAGTVIMATVTFFEPPIFRTQAKIVLASNRADAKVSSEQGTMGFDRIDERLVNSEATWFQSEGVLREVLEPWRAKREARRATSLGSVVSTVVQFPFEIPGRLYQYAHGAPVPTVFDRWVASVRKRLVVSAVAKSNLIEMSYTDTNPEFATQLLNALIASRMKRQASFSRQEEAQVFYDEQTRLLMERMRQAQDALLAFYEREGVVGGPEERKALQERLTERRSARAQAETELAEARVRAEFLQKAIRGVPRRVEVAATSGSSMQNRLLELKLERSKLLATYAPTSVKIVDLDQQIAETQRMLREESKLIADMSTAANPTYIDLEKQLIETQVQVAALEARSASLAEQEQGYVGQMQKLVTGTPTVEQLETDLERAREAHRTYVAKREDARFSSALDASQILNMTVLEPATVPTTPVAGRGGLSILLGALAGLMAGVVLAYLRDLIDPTVKTTAEVSRLTGLPVLGEVSP